jgi:hypothetical protein
MAGFALRQLTIVNWMVWMDRSESAPLAAGSDEWKTAKSDADAARLAHLATLSPVTNQMGRGANSAYAICADPDSETKHPDLPNCTMTPENWSPPICLIGGSRSNCIGQPKCDATCKFINCSDAENHPEAWRVMENTNGVSGLLPHGPFTNGPGVTFLGNFSTLDGCWAACNASTATAAAATGGGSSGEGGGGGGGGGEDPCREFVYKPFRVSKWGKLSDCYQVSGAGLDRFVTQSGVTSGFLSYGGSNVV